MWFMNVDSEGDVAVKFIILSPPHSDQVDGFDSMTKGVRLLTDERQKRNVIALRHPVVE